MTAPRTTADVDDNADEEADANNDETASNDDIIDEIRLPLLAKIYGALCLIVGAVAFPLLIWAIIVVVRSIDMATIPPTLTVILTVVHALMLVSGSAALIVFGVLLLRNRRRYAARWAYVLMPITILQGLSNLALFGLGPGLLLQLLQLALLVVISVTADPLLALERRKQRLLRRIKEQDELAAAARINMVGRDLTGRGYIALDFFNLFWVFVVASVVGLGIETVYHMALYHGELQDRAGLLYGPFSPIYGFGGLLLTVFLNRLWNRNPVLIFLASAVIGGAFEYATSWFMEVAFGVTAWDYTGQWLSIGGRTSGKYMIMWGLLGVIWIRWCLPRLLRLINRIPWQWRYGLTVLCFVLMFINGTMTLMALDCWYSRVSGLEPSSPIEMFFANHYDNAYMQHRFQTMTIDPSLTGRV
ncbi:membrane protein [Bifidobacterium sp. UTCIF-39]|uniref:putative ABC transporter permease n=1 Tax=Bifidobacterium sp. UTCIF-39 TaxID=1465359 RepID=UPI00112E8108|nr:putative ABC transporter permease [Bifidobacterium sp. UTCIF-39]TPF95892.1 membrane protein [Bifidobacterium sp. UTCIF-39]